MMRNVFGERNLQLQLTDRARKWFDDYMSSSALKNPIPIIQWSRVRGDPHEQLMIGLYEVENVSEGWLGIAGDFRFIVIQEWLLDRLEGKTLDAILDAEGRIRISIST